MSRRHRAPRTLLMASAAIGALACLSGCEILAGIHERTLAGTDAGAEQPCLAGGVWPDSATRFCSDGSAAIDCDSPGAQGQDGSYVIHPPQYQSEPGWSMQHGDSVYDVLTRLHWEKIAVQISRWDDAQSYCESLGPGWRLPSRLELTSIVDYGSAAPAIDGSHFAFSSGATDLCASSSLTPDGGAVWGIDFAGGQASLVDRAAATMRARCVLGQPVASCFSLSAGGAVVQDDRTGLMWRRQPPPELLEWRAALDHCESLVEAGFDDWRLPNAKELQSIVDDSRLLPAIDIDVFPAASGVFWSSSVAKASPDQAWVVDFDVGESRTEPAPRQHRVRCTR